MMTIAMDSYVAQVRRVLWLTLGVNLTVVAIKLIMGLMSSSLAIISDAAHSAVDGLNNLMGLLVMSWVRPYADPDHPYGHAKFEMLGALGVAAFMLVTVYEIASHAVARLFGGGAPPHVTLLTIVVFSLTLIGNVLVIWYERREGRRLQSQLLLADARHTQTDLLMTVGIIVGLGVVAAGYPRVDVLISLLMAVVVAFTAYHVVRDAVPVLVDQAVYDPTEIQDVVTQIPGVDAVEDIRTRSAGPGCFIELTIQVTEQEFEKAHAVADDVEDTLREHCGPDCTVTVHMEPAEHEEGEEAA